MSEYRTISFYKPYDVLSNFLDPEGRKSLKEFIDIPDVYAAGRLDRDSEGLLLLSNDGRLIQRLTDPRFHLPKTYFVQIEGSVTPEALARLSQGVIIGDYQTQRCQVMQIPQPDLPPRGKSITPHGPTEWLRIVLREGKKRQIRHMTAAVGLPTLRLVRIAIGPITLGDLEPGGWRDLTPVEVADLWKKM
jgi:23S rRNA pseudouridine2457 synthase